MNKLPWFALGIWLLLVLPACSSEGQKGESADQAPVEGVSPDKAESVSGSDQDADAAPESEFGSNELELLSFSKAEVPVEFEGEVVGGAKWTDRNGLNYLVISEKVEGEFYSPGYVSNLYGYHYSKSSNDWKLNWSIKEFNSEIYEAVSLWKETISVTDLDEDGFAETCFIYSIEPDGLDPGRFKLMLHVKGSKYAIRGQMAASEEDIGEVEEKKADPGLKDLPSAISEMAHSTWDNFQKALYERF